jgi:hypothetical protein
MAIGQAGNDPEVRHDDRRKGRNLTVHREQMEDGGGPKAGSRPPSRRIDREAARVGASQRRLAWVMAALHPRASYRPYAGRAPRLDGLRRWHPTPGCRAPRTARRSLAERRSEVGPRAPSWLDAGGVLGRSPHVVEVRERAPATPQHTMGSETSPLPVFPTALRGIHRPGSRVGAPVGTPRGTVAGAALGRRGHARLRE